MRRFALALCITLATLVGCSSSSEEGSDDPTCQPGARKTYILTALGFTRETAPGVAQGIDLDRHVTAVPEEATCGRLDLKAPDGTPGIDNQLALLVPVVEKQFGNAIDGIIQGAVNDGRLLISLDLTNVNDMADDRCVDMEVKLGEGKPSLGTDGVLDAYQTFDLRKTGQLVSPASNGRIEKGVFTIGPFPLRIPIAVFDVSFTIFLRDAIVTFRVDEEGNLEGMLGGGVSVDEIADGVKDGAGVAKYLPEIRTAGLLYSDMGYDGDLGRCTLMSAALTFKARPAFLR
jgi:hypothetical protein